MAFNVHGRSVSVYFSVILWGIRLVCEFFHHTLNFNGVLFVWVQLLAENIRFFSQIASSFQTLSKYPEQIRI